MKTQRLAFLFLALTSTVMVASSCGESAFGADEDEDIHFEIGSIKISPSVVDFQVGSQVSLSALVLSTDGKVIRGKSVKWHSVSDSIADVDADGTATAKKPGRTKIVGSTGPKSDTVDVTVRGNGTNVVRLNASPASFVLTAIGAGTQLQVQGYDSAGSGVTGLAVTWRSLNAAVATVDSTGRVTAKSIGSALIITAALCCDVADTVSVSVEPRVHSVVVSPASAALSVGSTMTLSAVARDSLGTPVTGKTVWWTSLTPERATVSGSGVVTAAGTGTATVRAVVDGISGDAVLSISATPPPVSSVANVTVSPASTTLTIGTSQQLAAILKDAQGNVLTGRPVTWSSSNSAVATVNSSGVATAVAAGAVTITASSEGISGSAAVTATGSTAGSEPNVFSDGFELANWSWAGAGWNTAWHMEDISIVNGHGGRSGNIARFFYNAGTNADDNVALTLTGNTLPNVDHLFIRGYLYMPDPGTSAKRQMQRKLIYLTNKLSPTYNLVFGVYGGAGADGVPSWYLPGEINGVSYAGWTTARTATLFNNWHYIELEVKLNTPGRSDGYVRLWVNDPNTPLVTLSNKNLRGNSTNGFNELMLGQQLQGDANSLSEYRYWDDFAVSTNRIGPNR